MKNLQNYNLKQYSTKANNDIELTSLQKEVLVGHILGDGHIQQTRPTFNARIIAKQSTIHTEFLQHLYDIFESLCNSPPKITQTFYKKTGNIHESISFTTRSLPCLNIYRKLFYNDKVKVVPSNIDELLTPIGLAIWIIGDGSKVHNFDSLLFHTGLFTLDDIQLLIKALKLNFDIDCTYQFRRFSSKNIKIYCIYVRTKSINKLRKLVTPHIVPSILYKIGL